MNKTEISTWLFLFLAMFAGIGVYHIAQITGSIGGVMPAEADWAPPTVKRR